MIDLKKIKKEFDSLSAKLQWKWVVDSQLKNEFTINLDNDNTFIYFKEDKDADFIMDFKADIGDREGVECLLKGIGCNVEFV